MSWREEFTERIMNFASEPHYVTVSFSIHAGAYRLPVARDDFAAQMANIAAAYQANVAVPIVLDGDEVISVGAPQ